MKGFFLWNRLNYPKVYEIRRFNEYLVTRVDGFLAVLMLIHLATAALLVNGLLVLKRYFDTYEYYLQLQLTQNQSVLQVWVVFKGVMLSVLLISTVVLVILMSLKHFRYPAAGKTLIILIIVYKLMQLVSGRLIYDYKPEVGEALRVDVMWLNVQSVAVIILCVCGIVYLVKAQAVKRTFWRGDKERTEMYIKEGMQE